jgi:hypothetical protein
MPIRLRGTDEEEAFVSAPFRQARFVDRCPGKRPHPFRNGVFFLPEF